MTITRTIDALGTHCPVPARLLARAAERLPPGAQVEVLADDPLVELDIPAWCHAHHHTVTSITHHERVWSIVVTLGRNEPTSMTAHTTTPTPAS